MSTTGRKRGFIEPLDLPVEADLSDVNGGPRVLAPIGLQRAKIGPKAIRGRYCPPRHRHVTGSPVEWPLQRRS